MYAKDAPEGFINFVILDTLARRMPQRVLLVVEEPEIHKNPLKVMEYVERLVKIINDDDTQRLGGVDLGEARRSAQAKGRGCEGLLPHADPWTRAEEVKIFPDGTVEKLPDWEEATAALF